ncbi:MAG: FkbM family methyltransferase, partial [Bacteroidia bacterium]
MFSQKTKNFIKNLVEKTGFVLQRKSTLNKQFNMEGGISRIKERGLIPQTIIDIGASNGSWSELCLKYFPNAHYFLVEAQQPHEPDLKKFIKTHPKSEYILAAAGDNNGEIYFNNTRL